MALLIPYLVGFFMGGVLCGLYLIRDIGGTIHGQQDIDGEFYLHLELPKNGLHKLETRKWVIMRVSRIHRWKDDSQK